MKKSVRKMIKKLVWSWREVLKFFLGVVLKAALIESLIEAALPVCSGCPVLLCRLLVFFRRRAYCRVLACFFCFCALCVVLAFVLIIYVFVFFAGWAK
jgi:hypothetical protein